MHLKFRNVNDAFTGIVEGIHRGTIPTSVNPSRNGEVLVIEEPVIITYSHPRERVLFNSARDANPFFHLYEALWMLAGRNDLKPLEYYVSTFGQFSDDGKTLNGAYGYRWRHAKGPSLREQGIRSLDLHPIVDRTQPTEVDQLAVLIDHLRSNPFSRRAVLQMWNVEDDLLKIDSSKDVCCNLSVLFSVETGPCRECEGAGYTRCAGPGDNGLGYENCERCGGTPNDQPHYLNMTVFNRSNDTILGALGANVVHFSFLQEYMACCLGLEVGKYNQVSNNLHVYTNNWKPEEWLERRDPPISSIGMTTVPLVHDPATFDREVQDFIDDPEAHYNEPFLRTVAAPMCLAFRHHKERNYGLALEAMRYVVADDWRIAGTAWIERRQAAYEKKQGATKI